MSEIKILVVEDDINLLDTLKYNLLKESYTVVTATDGAQALDIARAEEPDIVILDIMLPSMSGLEVCRVLRKETMVPIMMLTAKDEEVDKIVGLEIGADDYMTKPFSMRELLARLRAMVRRSGMAADKPGREADVYRTASLEINVERHQVFLRGQELDLSPKEYELLLFLVRNKEIVFSREQLLEKIWGYDYAGDSRTVDVHVRWLRKKIESDPSRPGMLVTVRGAGYKLVD